MNKILMNNINLFKVLKASCLFLLLCLTVGCSSNLGCVGEDDGDIFHTTSGTVPQKTVKKFNVKANGNYGGIADADYGRWLDTGIRVTKGQKFLITIGPDNDVRPPCEGDDDPYKEEILSVNANTSNWTNSNVNLRANDAYSIEIGPHSANSGALGNKWSTWNGAKQGEPAPSYPSRLCYKAEDPLPCWYVNGVLLQYAIDVNGIKHDIKYTGAKLNSTATRAGKLSFKIQDSVYSDNLGGYQVKINKYGCMGKNQGNNYGLTFAISNNNPAEVENIDITNIDKDGEISAINTGRIWLRVANSAGDYKSMQGSYNASITTWYYASSFSLSINSFMESIKVIIIDSAKNFFNGIVIQSSFNKAVRATLTVYIIIYAIMFIYGMTEINKLDLVVRLLKIGIIIVLISPKSWEFFNDYLFNIFIGGGKELLSYLTGSENANNPFGFLDQTMILLMFNPNIGYKILALLVGSFMGFPIVALIVYSTYVYIVAVLKAIIAYAISFVALALLICIAPVFIPFMLFQITFKLFDTWIRRFFRYMLEPILLLFGLSFLNHIASMAFYKIFNFSICWKCVLPIKIFSILEGIGGNIPAGIGSAIRWAADVFWYMGFCLHWFLPWGADTETASVYDYIGGWLEILSYALILLFITDFMKKFSTFVHELVISLTNASWSGANIIGAGSYYSVQGKGGRSGDSGGASEMMYEGLTDIPKAILGKGEDNNAYRAKRQGIKEQTRQRKQLSNNNNNNNI